MSYKKKTKKFSNTKVANFNSKISCLPNPNRIPFLIRKLSSFCK